MSELPKATVPSALRGLGPFAARSAVLFALLSAGYAATQAGCRNDAITYAKALDPEAKCSAIKTCFAFCKDEPDVAVCRFGSRSFSCSVGGDSRFNERPMGCTEVQP